VSPTGSRKKSPIASASEKMIVPTHMPLPISSSCAEAWASAEMPRALKPIFSDSPSATTPRMIGSRSTRWRLSAETSGSEMTSISPAAASRMSRSSPWASCSSDGLRTATAQIETPRIITPSSTAWPPIGASLRA
jgi:hypothetical protein